MERKSVYWVWRRSDGYVGCTKSSHDPGKGFSVLLETPDLGEARAKLAAERDDRHRALIASWDT